MRRTYSKRLRCVLSLCGFIFAIHSYKNVQWLHFLSQRQRITDVAISRSLLPNTLTRPFETKHREKLLCSRDQIKYGEWVPQEIEKPPYVSRNKHLRCYPDEVYEHSPWHTWAWKPFDESCTLTEWSADHFCRLMNKVTVSIIGDSLSWEQYSSLMQLLGEKVRQTDQHKSRSENRNHLQTACSGNTRIVFRNDARLSHVSDSIHADFPLVLVLNRGAHYANDTELLRDIQQNIAELHQWQHTCRQMGIRCHLYWRTTVPGHPRCTEFNETEPVNDFVGVQRRISDLRNYDNVTINYHWYDFARQNSLVLKEFESSGLEYSILDAYHLNILRPDEHRSRDGDCLHNCYPGKMDVYNQLLLHFLNMERSDDDIRLLLEKYESAKERLSRDNALASA